MSDSVYYSDPNLIAPTGEQLDSVNELKQTMLDRRAVIFHDIGLTQSNEKQQKRHAKIIPIKNHRKLRRNKDKNEPINNTAIANNLSSNHFVLNRKLVHSAITVSIAASILFILYFTFFYSADLRENTTIANKSSHKKGTSKQPIAKQAKKYRQTQENKESKVFQKLEKPRTASTEENQTKGSVNQEKSKTDSDTKPFIKNNEQRKLADKKSKNADRKLTYQGSNKQGRNPDSYRKKRKEKTNNTADSSNPVHREQLAELESEKGIRQKPRPIPEETIVKKQSPTAEENIARKAHPTPKKDSQTRIAQTEKKAIPKKRTHKKPFTMEPPSSSTVIREVEKLAQTEPKAELDFTRTLAKKKTTAPIKTMKIDLTDSYRYFARLYKLDKQINKYRRVQSKSKKAPSINKVPFIKNKQSQDFLFLLIVKLEEYRYNKKTKKLRNQLNQLAVILDIPPLLDVYDRHTRETFISNRFGRYGKALLRWAKLCYSLTVRKKYNIKTSKTLVKKYINYLLKNGQGRIDNLFPVLRKTRFLLLEIDKKSSKSKFYYQELIKLYSRLPIKSLCK